MSVSGSYNYPGIHGAQVIKQGPINAISTPFGHDMAVQGRMFVALTESLSVSQGTKVNVLIRTPPYNTNNMFVALSFTADCDSKARIAFYEGPTVSSSGSDISSYNINRVSSLTVSNLNFYGSSSITNSGTLLGVQHIGLSRSISWSRKYSWSRKFECVY